MAQVTCYLPDSLKERALQELPPGVSFSQLLRFALIDALQHHSGHRHARAGCEGHAEPS